MAATPNRSKEFSQILRPCEAPFWPLRYNYLQARPTESRGRSKGTRRVVSYGTRWVAGIGVRRFVRTTALLVGLANLAALPFWFGYPFALTGEEPLDLVLLPALATVIAALATSELVLRATRLPGRGFAYRYPIAAGSVCLGGMMLGAPLGVMFGVDGTLGADPSPAFYEDPVALLGALVSA